MPLLTVFSEDSHITLLLLRNMIITTTATKHDNYWILSYDYSESVFRRIVEFSAVRTMY